MKTTLILDDEVLRRLKAYAREQRMSASAAAQDLIRAGLARLRSTTPALPRLPTFHGGSMKVSVDSRAALYEVIGEPLVLGRYQRSGTRRKR